MPLPLQGPEPYPAPTAPVPFTPPTGVPEQQGVGPTFGGTAQSTAPQVGVGYLGTPQPWRLPGGGLARDIGGLGPSAPLREGLDTQPADFVLQSLFQMPNPELRALQLKMYDAGYYGNVSKDAVVFGSVDDATWGAYGDLLEQTVNYNRGGRDIAWFDVLDETQRLRKEQGTNLLDNQGPKRDPFVAHTTATADVEAVIRDVAHQLLGGKADPAQVASIVARYRASETSAQRAAYDAAGTGGTVSEAPNAQVFAEQALTEANPVETEAYRGADQVLRDFGAIIEGPFGG